MSLDSDPGDLRARLRAGEWQARGRLEERGSLEALLFQIARNGARDRGLPDRAGPLRAGWPPVRIER
jgi:hypothetical protein